MVEERSFNHKFIALTMFAFGIFLQGITFFGLIGYLDFFKAIHFIACHLSGAVFIGVSFSQTVDKKRNLFLYLSLMLAVIFPVGGAVSIAVIYLYQIVFGVDLVSEDDLDVSLDEESVLKSEENIDVDADQFIRQRLDVESFSDILHGDNFNLKRSVIEILAQKDDRESIKLLKFALKDSEPEVRFHASAGLRLVGETFQRRIFALQEEYNLDTSNNEISLLLAKEYFRFCRSRLADISTQQFYLNKSLESIIGALKIKPDDVTALLVLGKIKIEMEDYRDAVEQLNKAHKLDESSWEVMIWRCEANFYLGEFDKIKEDCEAVAKLKPMWDRVGNVTKYWMKHAS